MTSSRRLSDRSATTPAHAPSSSTGAKCAAASSPSATPLPVRCSTSSVWATIDIQVPVWLTICPRKKSRKLRIRSEAKVAPVNARARVIGRPRRATPGARRSFGSHAPATPGRRRPAERAARPATRSSGRGLGEQGLALGGGADTTDAPVLGVGEPLDEVVVLEPPDDLGDGGRRHPLQLGELAERERAVDVHHRQRREHARRQVDLGLLAEPTGQARPRSRRSCAASSATSSGASRGRGGGVGAAGSHASSVPG